MTPPLWFQLVVVALVVKRLHEIRPWKRAPEDPFEEELATTDPSPPARERKGRDHGKSSRRIRIKELEGIELVLFRMTVQEELGFLLGSRIEWTGVRRLVERGRDEIVLCVQVGPRIYEWPTANPWSFGAELSDGAAMDDSDRFVDVALAFCDHIRKCELELETPSSD